MLYLDHSVPFPNQSQTYVRIEDEITGLATDPIRGCSLEFQSVDSQKFYVGSKESSVHHLEKTLGLKSQMTYTVNVKSMLP